MTPSAANRFALLILAFILSVIGVSMAGALVVGMIDGVRGKGPLLLGAVAVGAGALAIRLFLLARAERMPKRSRPRPH